ncbi:putative Type I secretion membrane fusion protein, HlyD [Candidatus Terasakiella magnetica]|uniref:Membrane fusion protein (MFP) family protein n=1 Tax=Candidatus Terasakiella magnetica TaxID=1867952 RepID=A0A1C3REN0_9PROT|nr:HlyD family type I secretion periplasmic adaptor subunit [Candidatus Terasakiella magnetica]SCA55701.1 putative Type I secretion membrane fusion protein, HlyD [Candidatus Terasakiella magnetica]
MNTPSPQNQEDLKKNERPYAAGDFIFQEGEVGNVAYVVVSGTVEVCKLSAGKLITLQTLEEGALFGEMAIIDKSPRSASARAVTDVVVREIDETALMGHIKKAPEVAMNMMYRLASYVRTSNKNLESSSFDKDVEGDQKEIKSDKKPWRLWKPDEEAIVDEFRAGAEAIEHQGLPRVISMSFLGILGVFFGFIIWASLSVIDTTVSARGRLTTTVPTIEVQSTGSAMVKKLHSTIGKHVKKGDVLVTLDATFAQSDLTRARQEVEQLDTEIFRLEAEMNKLGMDIAKDIPSRIQRDIYLNRQDEYRSRITSFDQDLRNIALKLKSAKSDAGLAAQQLKIKQKLEAARKRLFVKQIGSEVNYLQARNERLMAERELTELQNSMNTLRGETNALKAKKQAFVSEWFSSIGEKLAAATNKRDAQSEGLVKLRRQRKNIEILAPADGVIIALENLYEGGVVKEGATVMTLVPSNVPLNIEIDIDPRDISNLYPGAEMSVKLDAIPYQKHGDLAGEITFISEDTVEESLTGEKGTYYRIHAAIQANNLHDLPEDFRLVPGMLLTGDIRVGRRRLITYFIYPVIRTIETSFTEPN